MVLYSTALVLSLTLIYIDETVYFVTYIATNVTVNTASKSSFTSLINSVSQNSTVSKFQHFKYFNYFFFAVLKGVGVWKGLTIARTVLCMLAWLQFSVFVKHDRTCELLEKRDFSLLDDIATNDQQQQQPTTQPPQLPPSLQMQAKTSSLINSNNRVAEA
jgi:hypothetical protein